MKPKKKRIPSNTGQSPIDFFDTLYDTHKTSIFSYACYLTKNQKDAEDLFQETWLRVAQNPPKTKKVKDLKAWLFVITTNLHRDLLRKKRIRRLFLLDRSSVSHLGPGIIALEETRGPFRGPTEFERAETHRAISNALGKLPEKLRNVFVLKEIEGFKYLEISSILGIPVGTVKSMTYRAIRLLRRELAVLCPD